MKKICLCLILFTLCLTFNSMAGTIYVPANYPTIQQAINNAVTGDTIIVSGGPYPEKLTISTPGITLEGDGTHPVINPACVAGESVIMPTAADITIRGFEITNASGLTTGEVRAVYDGTWSTGYPNLTIDDCIIHHIDLGIRAYGANLTVTNCELHNLRLFGIHASGNDGGAAAPILIQNNWCHDWNSYNKEGAGISVRYDNRVGEVSYNYISGMRMGIAYYYGGPRDGLGEMVFAHNTIDFDYDPGTNAVSMTMGMSLWGTGDGADNVIIRDNIFANALWYGIYQEGATITGQITVDNNLFYNNYWYYWPDYQYPYQWFGDDTLAQAGWYEGPASGFSFTNNISASNPMFQLSEPGVDQWKLESGSPAMRSASDGTNIGANQWTPPGQVWVDDDYTPATSGWGVDHFDNISDGVDAVDTTGTVTVYSGIYPEDVQVDKGIIMEGIDVPFIEGEATSTGLAISSEGVEVSGFAVHHFGTGIDIATSGSAVIEGCYIFSNTNGLKNQNTMHTTDADLNWWGDNSGPSPAGSGNGVIGDVAYDPWIGKTARPDGAGDFNPGGTGSFGTGAGNTMIDLFSNSSTDVSLALLSEEEGAFPQGTFGFAGGNAVERRVIITPYYLSDGQFMATLKLYYSMQDLNDAGIPSGGWLTIYTWDTGSSKWLKAVDKNVSPSTENLHQGDKAPDAVLGHYGTNTAEGYAWANIDHFSEFALGQDGTVPVELSVFSVE